MNHLIAPSILAADFANLKDDILMLNDSVADWIHVDVMDGMFVPNISFGMPVIEAVKKHALLPLDVHLMIAQPERYLSDFKQCGADVITVHAEACTHLHRTVEQIKDLGCMAGVALNPHTSVSVVENIIRDVDLVLIMSVNPGFGGQKFISHTYQKIMQLKQLAQHVNPNLKIEVDGGVSMQNAADLLKAGANVLVAGNSVFKSEAPMETISQLKDINTHLHSS